MLNHGCQTHLSKFILRTICINIDNSIAINELAIPELHYVSCRLVSQNVPYIDRLALYILRVFLLSFTYNIECTYIINIVTYASRAHLTAAAISFSQLKPNTYLIICRRRLRNYP